MSGNALDAHQALGRTFFHAQDRVKGLDSNLCSPNYIAHIGGNPPMRFANHETFAKAFYAAFPDLRHTVEDTVADADRVAVRFTLRGTHVKEFMGIPPTNKSFEIGAIAILWVADGKVTELHGQFDPMGIMGQFGVIQ